MDLRGAASNSAQEGPNTNGLTGKIPLLVTAGREAIGVLHLKRYPIRMTLPDPPAVINESPQVRPEEGSKSATDPGICNRIRRLQRRP